MSLHEYVARATRYAMQLVVEYRTQSTAPNSRNSPRWFKGTSHNISASGILFSLEAAAADLAVAAPIEIRVLMPPELNPARSARARCVGRVVRIEQASPDYPIRVAATIDRYKLEPIAKETPKK